MNNYTEKKLKEKTEICDVYNRETGEHKGELGIKPNKYLTLAAKGYRKMYLTTDGIYEKFMKSLSSSLEISISIDFFRDIEKNGTLSNDQLYYEKKHNTSRHTVGKVFTKAKKTGLFKSAGRTIYVNPYVVVPYQSDDKKSHFLQRQWDLLWKASNDTPNGKLTKAMADKVTADLMQEFI